MGQFSISIKHLYDVINTTNKLNHCLSKSDLNVKAKQNFTSRQHISNDKVLNLLHMNDKWKGTYNYMLILNFLIMSYTQTKISLLDRIFYAWIAIFYVRLWRIWLRVTRRIRKLSMSSNEKSYEQNYFITSNALLSIELNGPCIDISLFINRT